MSIAFVSLSTAAPTGTSVLATQSTTINAPTSIVAGNLLVAIFWTSSSQRMGSSTLPSGWTQVGLFTPSPNANCGSVCVAYKYATGAEPANYTFSLTTASSNYQYGLGGIVLQYSGTAASSPIDTSASTPGNSATGDSTLIAPSVSPGSAGELLLCAYERANGQAVSTHPVGMTNRADFGNGSSGGAIDVEELALTSAGATGTNTLTLSTADFNRTVSFTIVAAISGTGSDNAAATDVATSHWQLARNAADSAPATDVAARGGSRGTDSASATDSVSRQVIQSRALADTAGASDAATRIAHFARATGDSAAATDSATVPRVRTATDHAPAVDAATALVIRPMTVPYGLGWESNGRQRTGSGILTVDSPIQAPPTVITVALAAPITSIGQTTIQITDATAVPVGATGLIYIQVNAEIMLVTAGFGTTTLTVVRAQLGTTAQVSAIVGTPVAVSSPYHSIVNASETYSAPTLSDYMPVGWTPSAQSIAAWGSLRLVVNGKDATFVRNAPVIITDWSDVENFGDDTLTFVIYSSSVFEPLGGGKLPWLTDNATIQLQRVLPNGSVVILWEGDVAGIDDTYDGQEPTVTVRGIGVLKTLDDRITKPRFNPTKIDTGVLIAKLINAEVNEGFRLAKMSAVALGATTTEVGEYGALLGTVTIQDLLVSTVVADGGMTDGVAVHAITNKRPRGAQIVVKDKAGADIVLYCGQRGVTHALSRDPTQILNAIYGQGTDTLGNEWRNTKYPNAPVAPPAYPLPTSPLQTFICGDGHTGLLPFSNELRTRGYTDLVSRDTYNCGDTDVVERFQRNAGILVDGIIGPQTWNAAFQTGTNAKTLFAYVQAIAYRTEVERWTYNARGGVTGKNAHYDPAVVRREKLEQFGTLSRQQAEQIANLEIGQYGALGWAGTITMTNIDPPQMCGLDVRSGMNVLYKGHRGADRLMHIAQCKKQPGMDAKGGTANKVVSMTVDEKFRDFMTLAQMLKRERGIVSMSSRTKVRHRHGSRFHDYAPYDAESGAGYLPISAQTAGLWNFYQIPAGAAASITHVRIVADQNTKMAACVFDRPTNAAKLLSITGYQLSNPESTNGNGDDGWTAHASALRTAGLQWANGGSNGMQGYWPNTTSGALTGVLDDAGSWPFVSKSNPWAWLGVWTALSCTISGDPANNYWCLFAGATD